MNALLTDTEPVRASVADVVLTLWDRAPTPFLAAALVLPAVLVWVWLQRGHRRPPPGGLHWLPGLPAFLLLAASVVLPWWDEDLGTGADVRGSGTLTEPPLVMLLVPSVLVLAAQTWLAHEWPLRKSAAATAVLGAFWAAVGAAFLMGAVQPPLVGDPLTVQPTPAPGLGAALAVAAGLLAAAWSPLQARAAGPRR